eukprot:TRINITY_DN56266_c0_g1_i1.p1 TRINITY_DN56266_c0_g1~~TRINITY_DN56266_c0_g1_i1.p1  ORF type:complete len:185 (-),score=19.60 TRINITY_DN56266_c0_g1_i1:49-573(-)
MSALVPQSTHAPSTMVSGTYYPSYCTYNLQERDFLNPWANAQFTRAKGKRGNPNIVTTTPGQYTAAQQAGMGQYPGMPMQTPPPALPPQAQAQINQQLAAGAITDPTSLSNSMIQQRYAYNKRGRLLTVNDVSNIDKHAQGVWNERLLTESVMAGGAPFAAHPGAMGGYPGMVF